MRRNKRLAALIVCAVLLMGWTAAVAAEEVPRAARGYQTGPLERLDSFVLDEATGEWSAGSPMFSALEDAVAADEARTALNGGLLLWQLRLAGNVRTGTLAPALEFVYLAREALGVRAVSVIVGDTRYDLAAQATRATFGGVQAERLLAPLDRDTLELPARMAEAGEVGLVLHGAERIYATTASKGADGSVRERFEGACFGCLPTVDLLETLGAEEYALWDRTEAERGGAADWLLVDLSAETPFADSLPGMGRLLPAGTRGDAVAALQELLRSGGFYFGAAEAAYSAKTIAAVLRAQKAFGLPETGTADETLLACLSGGEGAGEPEQESEADLAELADARVAVSRWWTAATVTASRQADRVFALSCSDEASRLLVCEGRIVNAGGMEIGLGWQLTGKVTVDGQASYDCAVRAENGAGSGFAMSVAPLADCTLLITAEIPLAALEQAEEIGLALSLNGETLEYVLQP